MMPCTVFGQGCDCASFPSYKCISFGNLPDLIAAGDLLDYAEAQTEPQYIVVESFINFDDQNNSTPYHFASGSQILMLSNSTFTIRKEVIFDETTLFGCSNPWAGIEVYSNGILRMTGSNIANACHTILLRPGSKAEIASNYFANNGTCIEAEGNTQTIGAGIAHNTFDGNFYSISCFQLGTRWAITLDNIPHITIGNMTGGGAPNEFIAYDGIFANNTNLDIFNTSFIGDATKSGIMLRGAGGTYTAHVTGLGNTVNDPAFMGNYDIGIDAKNYNLSVENAYFNGANQHHIKINGSLIPARIVLSENYFDQYKEDAINVGLSIIQDVFVFQNTFRDDNFNGFLKSGIRWNSNQFALNQHFGRIRDNLFFDDEKINTSHPDLSFESYGIYLSSSKSLNLQDNLFYQNYNTSIIHDFKGILLRNAPQNHLITNGVFGNFGPMITSAQTSYSYRGIEIIESPETFVSCNHSQNLNEGFYFRGPASDKTDFRHNEMSDNLTGMYLFPGSIIGQQIDMENKWQGDLPVGGLAEAHFDGNPSIGALLMSRFLINSSNLGSILWANPRVPASGWFSYSGGQDGLPFICLKEEGPPPPKSRANDMLIGGTFEAYKGYPASEWEATLNAFATLDNNPELLLESSPEETFYNSHLGGNIGKLHRARTAWDDIALFSTAVEADWEINAEDIVNKLDEIKAENLAMEQAVTEQEQAQIAQTLESLKAELESLQENNQDLSAEYQSDVTARANTLISDLAEINTTEVWETNLKTVLDLSVEKLRAGNAAWASNQYTSLESIANQCRHEGGVGVVLARAAIEKFDYDDEAMCPGWVEERDNSVAVLKTNIAPNPANTLCSVSFDQPVSGALLIQNMQGQLIQNIALSGTTRLNVNTEKWPAGLYSFIVRAENGGFFSGKLAISH